jgi:hypothetical protein
MKPRIRLRLLSGAFLASALAVATGARAIPVIPGAAGFGIETPAGRGGTVHRVTNLNASGAGSLLACVDAKGPRVCIFEVGGVIRLTGDLVLRNPNLTIAGQTAPSPGIMLRGAALRVQTSDVLVQHIRVRVGDDAAGPAPDNRDALKIETTADKPLKNVVIDHCSFSWAIDETASVWRYWDNVSLLNNIFAEPLNESIHPKGAHGYGVLIGPHDGQASLIGNLMAHQVERNALSFANRFVYVNNVVYNRANMDVDLQQNGLVTLNSVVGNVFVRGPSYTRNNKPVLMHLSGTVGLLTGSKLYVSDNSSVETTSDPWSVVSATSSLLSLFRASSAPVWPAGLQAKSTANNGVYEAVLKSAGARPADRDAVDRRIVKQVRNRTGQIVNCVSSDGSVRCQKNAGGWPAMPRTTRRLTLPANHNAVTSSGYTNLELWLHSMARNVEGMIAPNAPAAPSITR